jgi:phosphoribosylformylglycinamidine cyclo-ligase
VARDEMLRTFNCGLGMVVAVDPGQVATSLAVIEKGGHAARVVGEVVARGDGPVVRYRGDLAL